MEGRQSIERLYRRRYSPRWQDRLRRWLTPPDPFVLNPREQDVHAPLGQWNLYIGGAGAEVPGYINLDLFPLAGVQVVASAQALPFPDNLFQRVECDAVLEHVEDPQAVMREIERTLRPAGFAHLVVPFCHPFHEYPRDYRRFTPDGLRLLAGNLEVVAAGWRTGPTATLLVFFLEYVKSWLPWRPLRVAAHGILGWLLFPWRYLDLLLFHSPRAGQIGNHCFLWLRKPGPR
ncbi:MAG TPA: methyltransferase domain-containing protein [Terriglobia bacterium]|nr:methyltransferase domain-containing protein [Terriglobia bacterium]